MTAPENESIQILQGDALSCLRRLKDGAVHTCVTSPPYWGLRDYGVEGQIGLEDSPRKYLDALLPVFDEVWRVLRDDGTLWLNLGDTYTGYHGNRRCTGVSPSDRNGYRENMRKSTIGVDGLKQKELAGIPWRVAFALQERGWYLRSDMIWHKPNPMPESVRDRPVRSHEYIFLLSKSPRYYYDREAVREDGVSGGKSERSLSFRREKSKETILPYQNSIQHRIDRDSTAYGSDGKRSMRSVRVIPVGRCKDAHFAVFPPELIRPCIRAGTPEGGVVLDPFFGSGTTGVVCVEEKRQCIGIELNPDYVAIANARIREACNARRRREAMHQLVLPLVYPGSEGAVRAVS